MPTPPPAVEHGRVVTGTPFAARTKLGRHLSTLGLTLVSGQADGPMVVDSFVAREEWADCRSVQVVDDTGRLIRVDWARPQGRIGALTIVVATRQGGTGVDIQSRFAATYLDRYRNTPFQHHCASTGELERSLLDAAS
jgi:hypothetical protein